MIKIKKEIICLLFASLWLFLCFEASLFASEAFHYSGHSTVVKYSKESSQVNAQLRDELASMVPMVSDKSRAGISVSVLVTVKKTQSKEPLGNDDGKQFLTRLVAKKTVTVRAYLTEAENGSHLRTFTSTFNETEQRAALRDLAEKIAAVSLPGASKTTRVSGYDKPEQKETVISGYGFYAPSLTLCAHYLYPLEKYAGTFEYGIGTSLTASVKNSRLWDMRFALESSFVYLSEQKLAAEDFNLVRLTAFAGLPAYKTDLYTSLVSVGGGYHFHIGDQLYKQPHMAIQLGNILTINENLAAGFIPGVYLFASNNKIKYYLDFAASVEYTF